MVSIILFITACAVLIIAGILLAKGHKKENNTYINIPQQKEEQFFNTKYDELNYLYKSGAIKKDEYKSQMKNIIN